MSPRNEATKQRNADFAKRLEKATQARIDDLGVPYPQKWLRDVLKEKFGTDVTLQAISRYFLGGMRPRDDIVAQIADVLEVDLAWLLTGSNPAARVADKRRHKAAVDGAVNLVAAMVQLAGGMIRFPDPNVKEGIDFFVSFQGVQLPVEVKLLVSDSEGKIRTSIASNYSQRIVVGVHKNPEPNSFEFIRIPSEIVETYGEDKGGFASLDLNVKDRHFFIGNAVFPHIDDFTNLEGAFRRKKPITKTEFNPARRALDLG